MSRPSAPDPPPDPPPDPRSPGSRPTPPPPARPPVVPLPAQRFVPELPITVVLLVITAGLVVVYIHHFRLGSFMIGCGVLLAAALRLTLSARQAGLLAVRSRALDVAVLAALAVAVLVLALLVPPLRT